MKYFIIIAVWFVVAILMTYGIVSFRKKDERGRIISAAFFSSAVLYALFTVGALVQGYFAKVSLYSLAVAVGNFTFFELYLYVKTICESRIHKAVTLVVAFLLAFDSFIFLINPFTGIATDYFYVDMYGLSLLKAQDGVFYIFHGLLRVSVVLLTELIYIIKIKESSKYYRTQYYVVVVLILVILGIEFCSDNISTGVTDITNTITILIEIAIFHLSYDFSPTRLMLKLQGLISDSIDEATVAYDNSGKMMAANRVAKEIVPAWALKSSELILDFLGNPKPNEDFRIESGNRIYSAIYKPVYDEKEILVAKVFIFHDITELEERIEKEQKLSRTDSLTGAYNRHGFFAASEQFLDTYAKDTDYALIVSGIFGFKGINSSYGTKAGDDVLKKIESMFHEYHHTYPLLYGRTAEGKFSVLLPVDYVEEIAADMSCINVDIGDDAEIHVDLYHGYIVLDDYNKSLDYYYERALLALSECKKQAKVSILEYSYEMEERILRQQELISHMHDAIREGQFFIELQPQITLDKRAVEGAEALVRWNHPKLGRVMPGEFIPLFEENGFIGNLDVYTWELAAKTIKQFETEGIYNGSISINVSRIDIMSMDVVSVLERIVNEAGIDKKKLHVEITESACADNRVKLVETMTRLRESGFILEIDDFGSGYSSLNALMKLPFDVIKLDMEFMRENNLKGKNGIIMNAIAGMIHRLGAKIIVEGVETEANVENMVLFEGDVAQGYYFSKPLSIDDFKNYIEIHKR